MRRLLLAAATLVLCSSLALAQGDEWTMLSDFDTTARSWQAESGVSQNVRVTTEAAHSGRRGLQVTMGLIDGGRMIRQSWQTDVADLVWSPDSRLRFWIKGSALAGRPHGGVIIVEAGGRVGGGDSHWILDLPADICNVPEWRQITTAPFSETANPDWAPDADGRLNAARISALLWVEQQDLPGDPRTPYTLMLDEVEASHVEPQPVRYREAEVEAAPAHVTPVWRGFKGRVREHPALVTFEDVTGWRVLQTGATEARMIRSEEEPCYEDLRYQAKLIYSSPDGSGHFELVPPAPIPVTERFNAACAWVFGNNWSWVTDPSTPQVSFWLRLRDASGQVHRLDLSVINFKFYGLLTTRMRDLPEGDPRHLFYGGAADGVVHLPAALEAIEVRGGRQPEPRTLYLESVALWQDDMPLPEFRPELIANLPFPTTAATIQPVLARAARTEVAREGEAFVLTARGDEEVTWRYEPATGTLSDLSVQVAGREAFRPCADGGPVLLLGGVLREPGAPEVTRELVGARVEGDAVTARWRASLGEESAEYTLSMRARGKSLVVDWRCEGQQATGLKLGKVQAATAPRVIRVPYLNIYSNGPCVALLGNQTFCSVLLDWYNTESSGFWCETRTDEPTAAVINGGSEYHPLTDGTRNPLGERQFISVSSAFEEVLPTIPNPPSTQAAVTREYLYCHLGGTDLNRFDRYLELWQTFHRKGIRKVRVSHHEDAWTNGADVGQGGQEYTLCTEAAPEVGDEKLIAYCRAMREMGYYIGLYENFTDYNPLGKSWDERNCARNSQGEMMRVWPPTYAMRPLKALEAALDYPRRVAAKFGTNTAYRDCTTAYPPWGQVDFQAGTPGAGKFSTNFRAWGALQMDGHKAYNGPIFSEGGNHWFSAGLVDGNYAQIWMPDAANYPLLLDFDLRKIHPLEADISMTPGWGWGPGGVWGCLSATIAYGHIGFLPFDDLATAGRYYYLTQQLQSRYTMIPATEILYHQDGTLRDISGALKAEALGENQVLVSYENGLKVAVNRNPEKAWVVSTGGPERDLRGFAWAASGPGFDEFCTMEEGRRIGYVNSPAYLYCDGGGTWRDFGPIASDGAVALVRNEAEGLRLIPLAQVTAVSVELPAGVRLEAYDKGDRPLGVAATTVDGTRVRVEVAAGVDYYRVVGEG